jgi:hypothetical protein
MERWSLQHRVFSVEQFLATGSVVQTQRNFRRYFHTTTAPSKDAIRRYVQSFRERGSVVDKPHINRMRTVRTPANILSVRDAMSQSPNKSLRRLSQQVGISLSTVQKIVKADLHLHPYKIQVVQMLQPLDNHQRLAFATWLLQQANEDASFIDNFFMSDEAHFHLSGIVNKQNTRFWATENPRLLLETPLHSERVTVWCAISSQHIIGPYFFQNEQGDSLTVTGDRYRQMLQNFFIPQLQLRRIRLHRTWFQQDGATCHTANETLSFLREKFPGRLISKKGDINWPPRSPDLSVPDFFLWGFLKSHVYRNSPVTLDDLRNNIVAAVAAISPCLLKKAMENSLVRARECVLREGHHLDGVIFHY